MNSELGHMWFMLNKIHNFVRRPPFKIQLNPETIPVQRYVFEQKIKIWAMLNMLWK